MTVIITTITAIIMIIVFIRYRLKMRKMTVNYDVSYASINFIEINTKNNASLQTVDILRKKQVILPLPYDNLAVYSTNTNRGYVYCISTTTDHNRCIYKIGMTNNIKRRISQLNTAVLDTLNLYYYITVKDKFIAEQQIHMLLEEYKISKREFFCVDLNIIKNIFNLVRDSNN